MHWTTTTVLICGYGILKEFRPGTPFLTPYLMSEVKNFTQSEVYGDIYPYWTYSYLLFMVPVFFLTDLLRYKPIIILEAVSLTSTWTLLVWGQGVLQMQLMQIAFGLASAAEIAYYSYLFAVVEESKYKRISSYIRSSAMVGKLIAFSVGQYLITSQTGTYLLLQQISLGAVSTVVFVSLFLPSVSAEQIKRISKSYTVTPESCEEGEELKTRSESPVCATPSPSNSRVSQYFSRIVRSLSIYRTSPSVLKWSIWWALATCGHYQICNYAQTLWVSMQDDVDHVKNGIAEIANTLISALLSFGMQYHRIDWSRWGTLTLTLTSILIGILQILSAFTHQIFVAYSCYVLSSAIHNMLITAACANIASQLTSSIYGIVFGMNTLVAVLLQSLLTFVLVDSRGFNLPIREQFVIYGLFFFAMATVFTLSSLISFIKSRCQPID